MSKLLASTYKEFLLLIRDIGGLAILFIMPLVLLITITLIQNNTFKTLKDSKIPILIVDEDNGVVSQKIEEGLTSANTFEVLHKSSEEEAKNLVFKGEFQLAIVIPKALSLDLETKVNDNVEGMLAKFGLEEELPSSDSALEVKKKEVRLYFDPATQQSFKTSVKNGIDKVISGIEIQTIYQAFEAQLMEEPNTEPIFATESFISFKEIVPESSQNQIPNASQHNIPAWALFAIFFIILPLSINMVKEKSQGTFVRLRTNPVSYATVLAGKTIVYLGVCICQFVLMLLVGLYLFPMISLPGIQIEGRLTMLLVVAVFAGLAAIGLGLMLGTVFKTHEQSAPFGATLVVILAALGGVWVPVFAMPKFMQIISNISPMNWGLNAFYDVFLRNVGFFEIIPEITLLFLFFTITTTIAIIYNEKKIAV